MGLVQSFCCGCTLRQGTFVSGIVSTIRGLFIFLTGCVLLVDDMRFHDHSAEISESPSRQYLLTTAGVLLGVGLFLLIASGLLFVGVSKEKPGFILPWIVWQSIEFFTATCFFILRFITGGKILLPDRGLGPISIVSMIYLYIVVLSYYKSLQRPPIEIPMAIRMTQINLTPGGYQNQPGYVVSLAGPADQMAPMPGYDPRSPGLVAYNPGVHPPSMGPSSAGYSQSVPGMPSPAPPPGFAYPGEVKPGVPTQFSHNPDYPPNPPPYQPPPPYSETETSRV